MFNMKPLKKSFFYAAMDHFRYKMKRNLKIYNITLKSCKVK
jgi:hypothetical protein